MVSLVVGRQLWDLAGDLGNPLALGLLGDQIARWRMLSSHSSKTRQGQRLSPSINDAVQGSASATRSNPRASTIDLHSPASTPSHVLDDSSFGYKKAKTRIHGLLTVLAPPKTLDCMLDSIVGRCVPPGRR